MADTTTALVHSSITNLHFVACLCFIRASLYACVALSLAAVKAKAYHNQSIN